MVRFRRMTLWALCWALASCAPGYRPPPPAPPVGHQPLAKKPKSRNPSLAAEMVDKTFAYQIRQGLDLPRQARRLLGRPYEALNVDAFDRVPDSRWFTNRNADLPLSPERVRRGVDHGGPPDTSAAWQVVGLKTAGVTPGLTVKDAAGARFIIKFDPPAYPGLGSATEAVVSRLLHAAGYHVPENHIVYFDPAALVPGPGATVFAPDPDYRRRPPAKRPLRQADLDAVLRRVNPEGAPRLRALASRFLPGIPVGPWAYTGVRRDDRNDRVPHEHRREVRGLYVVASWVNHADMKEENTLDMYDPDARLLTHYLIDFGAAMGSNSTGASNPRRGQANSFDLRDSLLRLLSLGLYSPAYERAPRVVTHPEVGYLENDLFRPDGWKAMYPVPAFENLTRRDAFWGARIVTSFSDAQIEAAVDEGRFRDPEAARIMADFLKVRRDRIGRHWFGRVNPLDDFAVAGGTLSFKDLAVERGYAAERGYRYRVRDGEGREVAVGQVGKPGLPLMPDWPETAVVEIAPAADGGSGPVRVFLDAGLVVGVRR